MIVTITLEDVDDEIEVTLDGIPKVITDPDDLTNAQYYGVLAMRNLMKLIKEESIDE